MAKKQEGLEPYGKLTLGESVGFHNPRTQVDAKEIRELADSIADRGLLNKLHVWKTKIAGKPVSIIVGGGRRYRAIGLLLKAKRANGLAKGVPVRYIEAETMAEAREIALIDNIQRKQLSSFEQATEIAAMEAAGQTKTVIAKKLGKSISWVSRLMTGYKAATPELKQAWKDGKLPDDDVQSIAKVASPTEQNKRLAKVIELRKSNGTDKNGKAKKAAPQKRAAARDAAKGKNQNTAKKPPKDNMLRTAQLLSKVVTKKPADAYVRGVIHGIEAALGVRGLGEFEPALEKSLKKVAAKSDKKGKK